MTREEYAGSILAKAAELNKLLDNAPDHGVRVDLREIEITRMTDLVPRRRVDVACALVYP
jgi:hypothetical protein